METDSQELTVAPARKARRARVRFTPAVIEQRAPKAASKDARLDLRDDLSPLRLRITPCGERSFSIRVRIKGQRDPVRLTYPERAHISNLVAAREWAVKTDAQCRAGIDPRELQRKVETESAAKQERTRERMFEVVAAAYLATDGKFRQNARGWKPGSKREYERILTRRLEPLWRGRPIDSITRDEISDHLAEVADATPVQANRDLAILSGMMSWYERQRGSNFKSPIVKGMKPADEKSRTRILSDDEIRVVWHVATRPGFYGAMVRQLLLVAARRSEVAKMRRSQIGSDGIWSLRGDQTKNHEPLFLPLSADSIAIIEAQPKLGDGDLIFSPDGKAEFKSFSHSKIVFDRRVLWRLRAIARAKGEDPSQVAPLPNWTLHDLRRTARSLMSRAKVRPDHAERVLNHKIGGVEGTYDRHSYEDEKREALERLAAMVRQIVNRQDDKVVLFRGRVVA